MGGVEYEGIGDEEKAKSPKTKWIIIGVLSAILVIAIIVCVVVFAVPKNQESYPFGAYFRYEEGVDMGKIASGMKKEKMDTLIFDPNGVENIVKIKGLKEKGINVHLMVLNGTDYITNHEEGVKEVERAVKVIESENIGVESFHVYCPLSNEITWTDGFDNITWAERNETFQAWVGLIRRVRRAVPASVRLSGAVSHSLDKWAEKGLLSGSNSSELVKEGMLDFLVVMHYGFDSLCLTSYPPQCPWDHRINEAMNNGARVMFAEYGDFVEYEVNRNNEETSKENKKKGLYLGTVLYRSERLAKYI